MHKDEYSKEEIDKSYNELMEALELLFLIADDLTIEDKALVNQSLTGLLNKTEEYENSEEQH